MVTNRFQELFFIYYWLCNVATASAVRPKREELSSEPEIQTGIY